MSDGGRPPHQKVKCVARF